MSRLGRSIRAFGAFWWDFLIGDDWRIALGVIIALAATGALATASVPAWWVLPVAVVGLLGLSLWRTVRLPGASVEGQRGGGPGSP